jgi:hypothetical protein
MEVLAGVPVTEVAARYRVSRQSVYTWVTGYRDGGLAELADWSHRPKTCPYRVESHAAVPRRLDRGQHTTRRHGCALALIALLQLSNISPADAEFDAQRRWNMLRKAVIGVMVLAMTLGLAGTANAGVAFPDWNDAPYHRVSVWGQVYVANDVTEWRVHARLGSRPSQLCVHLRMEVDRTLADDPVYLSDSRLCPGDQGVINFSSPIPSPQWSRTRGARLKVVWENSGSREVVYVRE